MCFPCWGAHACVCVCLRMCVCHNARSCHRGTPINPQQNVRHDVCGMWRGAQLGTARQNSARLSFSTQRLCPLFSSCSAWEKNRTPVNQEPRLTHAPQSKWTPLVFLLSHYRVVLSYGRSYMLVFMVMPFFWWLPSSLDCGAWPGWSLLFGCSNYLVTLWLW